MTKLFVYGTLKSTHHNNYILKQGKSQLISDDTTIKNHQLYSVDGLPVIRHKKGSSVKGELYEINKPTLERIRQLEGYPKWYAEKEQDNIVFYVLTNGYWDFYNQSFKDKIKPINSGVF